MRNFLFLIPILILNSCTYYFGINRFERHFRKDESFKFERNDQNQASKSSTVNYAKHPLVMHWAEMELPNWQESAKVTANRVVLAKLAAGRDVFEVNSYLLKALPNATIGTKWKLNPNGDYDFTEVVLAYILNKFSADTTVLLPVVAKHIAEKLIISGGDKPHLKTPGTSGLLRETENHVLMGTSALYLKNQWVYENLNQNVDYDNSTNGVEQFLVKFLTSLSKSGFYEFNSDPYSGYSLTAILMLHEQSNSSKIKLLCQQVLDQTFYHHALASLNFNFYPPIRRRMERANDPNFSKNPLNSLALTLYAKAKNEWVTTDLVQHNYHQALIGVLTSYSLPDEVIGILDGNKEEYFLKIGRGPNSSPEIYSGSADYLITAGGLKQKPASQLGSRPITLILNDEAKMLDEVFHLRSNKNAEKLNHTGVWQRFAVVDGKAFIPKEKNAVLEKENWSIYKEGEMYISIFQNTEMALLAVFPNWEQSAEELLQNIEMHNKLENLSQRFTFPDSKHTVSYDLSSKRKKWVITYINGQKTNRKFLKWERFQYNQI